MGKAEWAVCGEGAWFLTGSARSRGDGAGPTVRGTLYFFGVFIDQTKRSKWQPVKVSLLTARKKRNIYTNLPVETRAVRIDCMICSTACHSDFL